EITCAQFDLLFGEPACRADCSDQMGTCSDFVVFGSPADDAVKGMAIDASDHVYVTGHYSDSVDGSTPSMEAFLAKYDSEGQQVWFRQWGSDWHDFGDAVDVDPSGRTFIAGTTSGSFTGALNPRGVHTFLLYARGL
ncbi:MAG: hypothetical protein CVU65_17980, partial [Deltaproteobacteria bacterium HGW-Deltaproteobacteria-22]